MRKSWGIIIKFEHGYWYDSDPDRAGTDEAKLTAYAVNTIKVERQVEGDDEACDALYATQQALADLKKQYGIQEGLHVISIKVKEVM